MENIQPNPNIKRILINEGPEVLELDLTNMDRYFQFIRKMDVKIHEYKRRGRKVADGSSEAEALSKELCRYFRGQIDEFFGPGTSQKLFGDALSMSAIGQFFTGLTPYLVPARNGNKSNTNFSHKKNKPRHSNKTKGK